MRCAGGRIELPNVRAGRSFSTRETGSTLQLFDMLSEVTLGLRSGWSLNEPAGRAICWKNEIRCFVIGSLAQFFEVGGEQVDELMLSHLCASAGQHNHVVFMGSATLDRTRTNLLVTLDMA